MRLLPNDKKPSKKRGPAQARELVASKGALSPEDITRLERQFRDGLTATQAIEVFAARGIRFSEATFRKYVQQGLLPRSRRVGRKGKHRGSLGVYPAKTLGRINLVRQMMAEGLTIEEIQTKLARSSGAVDSMRDAIEQALDGFAQQVASAPASMQREHRRELESIREHAHRLAEQCEQFAGRLAAVARKGGIRRVGIFGSDELL